jgi:hypothetical protein
MKTKSGLAFEFVGVSDERFTTIDRILKKL